MAAGGCAIVVGAGPGLGAALVRRFAADGMPVAAAARRPDPALARHGGAYACDAVDEQSVANLFAAVEADLGPPGLVVYNAGAFLRQRVVDTDLETFEHSWRVGCLGGFLVGRAAARSMLDRPEVSRGGTIIFTGATASLRGGAGFVNLAVGKFGLRALAQSMARELGPDGIHVAHVVIDGQIRSPRYPAPPTTEDDTALDPDAIAAEYSRLHAQPRSAWTFELDLRTSRERF